MCLPQHALRYTSWLLDRELTLERIAKLLGLTVELNVAGRKQQCGADWP